MTEITIKKNKNVQKDKLKSKKSSGTKSSTDNDSKLVKILAPNEEVDSSTQVSSAPTSNTSSSLPTSFRVITGSYEHNLLCVNLSLYDPPVFTPIFHFTPHTQSIRCLAHSKRYLVSGSNDEHIRIYDLQKRKELGTLLHHNGSVTCLEFFDSKWLVSAAEDGKICIWRTKDWEVLAELKGHKGAINDISIHPSGKVAISVGIDRTLRLWNLMTGRKASVLKLGAVGVKAAWTKLGSHYILGFNNKLVSYSAETGTPINEISFKSVLQHMTVTYIEEVEYVISSHDNGSIVFRRLDQVVEEKTTDDGDDKEIDDLSSFTLTGHSKRVKYFNIFVHPSTNVPYMASVSSDGNLVVWDLIKRTDIAVYKADDRFNCCIIIPEDIEKANTMKKRDRDDDPEQTDISESEPELVEGPRKTKKSKKSKKTKASISVELEEED